MATATSPTTTDGLAPGIADSEHGDSLVDRLYRFFRGVPTIILWLIVVIWSIPTLGLFINALRSRDAQRSSGWWNTRPGDFTLDNYETIYNARQGLVESLLNTAAIALPATIIPIAFATFAAYGFAWIDFKGRKPLFIATVALIAIPLQVALIPLLQLYVGGAKFTLPVLDKTITILPDLDIAGTASAAWLTHIGFAMPFAIFLLHNYISSLPKDLFEAARIDGAAHFTIFWRLVLPLSIPVLAAFAIFQFLWTWNDFLIANTMIGANADAQPTTVLIANLAGDFGRNENLLPAAAFVQAFIPLIVFFALQRYFVRGLLAGSVKG
jgi:alpha-glucoside transport system permease protein